jgi:hypothetical protein
MSDNLLTKRTSVCYVGKDPKKKIKFGLRIADPLNSRSMQKRMFLTMVLVIFTAGFLTAQEGPRFRFGLMVSPSLSWFSPETRDYFSEGSLLGMSLGLHGEYRLRDHYAITASPMISNFGGKLRYTVLEAGYGVVDREREYRLRYFEFPMGFKLQSSEIGYFSYFGRIGFSPGFNLKAVGNDSFVQDQTRVTLERDIKGDIPLVRLAFLIGAGTEYSLGGRATLVGGLTYNNGFTNNLSGRNNINEAFQSATASYITVNLGVLF